MRADPFVTPAEPRQPSDDEITKALQEAVGSVDTRDLDRRKDTDR